MSDFLTFARPYAKAAFEFAKENKMLSEWLAPLSVVAEAVGDKTIQTWLNDPENNVEAQVAMLSGLVKESQPKGFGNLLSQLASNSRLALLPAIAELFIDFVNKDEQTVVANVESAFELSKEEIATLTENLKAKLGQDVEINTTINADLIAGIRVQAGDLVIDNTIKGRLDKMADGLSLSASN